MAKPLATLKKIETENKELTNDNKIESCIAIIDKPQKRKTLWIYYTSASEYITNNIKEEKIIIKCVNNSLCEFNGVRDINNYNITLDKAFYSKDINKNLLSGIKC
jgi:hypothetical protein